jgi:hypothetical protein
MSRSSLTTGIYVLLVFISGGVVGAFSHRLYLMNSVRAESGPPSPAEWRRRYVGEMKARLALGNDQMEKLNAILDSSKVRFKALNERHRPEYKAIQDDQVNQIRAVLTGGQRPEYEKFREEREALRREREKAKGW